MELFLIHVLLPRRPSTSTPCARVAADLLGLGTRLFSLCVWPVLQMQITKRQYACAKFLKCFFCPLYILGIISQ